MDWVVIVSILGFVVEVIIIVVIIAAIRSVSVQSRVNQHQRDLNAAASDFRQALASTRVHNTDFDALDNLTNASTSVVTRARVLLSDLGTSDFDPERLPYLHNLLEAQSDWLIYRVLPANSARHRPGEDKEDDRTWAQNECGELLRFVKDYILSSQDLALPRNGQVLLGDSFYESLSVPYFDSDGPIPLRVPQTLIDAAEHRWLTAQTQRNPRLRALVWYKVISDHACALFLCTDFGDPGMASLSRSERFALSTKRVWFQLYDDFIFGANNQLP